MDAFPNRTRFAAPKSRVSLSHSHTQTRTHKMKCVGVCFWSGNSSSVTISVASAMTRLSSFYRRFVLLTKHMICVTESDLPSGCAWCVGPAFSPETTLKCACSAVRSHERIYILCGAGSTGKCAHVHIISPAPAFTTVHFHKLNNTRDFCIRATSLVQIV